MITAPKFSVVICSRNPRREFMVKTLDAINKQSLDKSDWEVVLLDNGSDPPLSERGFNLPVGTRVSVELATGFNRARRAGVLAARGEWVVYVDDDNILDNAYIQIAEGIIHDNPEVDFFCGQIEGLYETEPPVWIDSLLKHLAIISFEEDCCTSKLDFNKLPAWTAGMVCRRQLLVDYFKVVDGDPFRLNLSRCEDHDFVVWAVREQGAIGGKFKKLRMKHQISAQRFDPKYLADLLYEQGIVLGQIARRDRQKSILTLQWDRVRAIRDLLSQVWCSEPYTVKKINLAGKIGYLKGLFKHVRVECPPPEADSNAMKV